MTRNHYAEQRLAHTYREAAFAAGLSDVYTYGDIGIYGGATCQWRKLRKAISAGPQSDSLSTAISQVNNAIAECLAPADEQ